MKPTYPAGNLLGIPSDNRVDGQIYHPYLGLTNYRVDETAAGFDDQVSHTIELMNGYVRQDAAALTSRAEQCRGLGGGCVIDGTFRHVKDNLSFVGDEITGSPLASFYGAGDDGQNRVEVVEVLIRPVDQELFVQEGKGQGDCDDFSMYTAAILTAAGVPCSFVTIAANPEYPEQFSHVYVCAYPNGSRVPMDTSHGPHPGWEYPSPYRMKEWKVGGNGMGTMLLLLAGAGVAYAYRKEIAGFFNKEMGDL